VSDDVIQRLFNKIDNLSDRLARVETMLEEREKALIKLELEREKGQKNYKGLFAWLVTTAIAVYAAAHK
jgi:chromosome segregation ATPase